MPSAAASHRFQYDSLGPGSRRHCLVSVIIVSPQTRARKGTAVGVSEESPVSTLTEPNELR